MTRSVRLRPWQKAAIDRFLASRRPDFLAVATPGAGKTTFALTAARHLLAQTRGTRVVVVAPTQHLKQQWADAAHRLGLHLDPAWSAADGRVAPDMHGIVTTYQQVATSAGPLRALAAGAFVVLDEIHHAADERVWGDSIRTAFEPAARRLSLSGTPFRSDTSPIPFVHYDGGQADADFEYGYGDALRDGRVVRPVYFPRTDGLMEWSAPDGSVHAHTFADALDPVRASQRLRTALSLEGEWLPTVLRQAHDQLHELRVDQPDAAGLVIAIDQEHARGIADLMRWRLGAEAVVVTSDDPGASARISRFAAGTDPWIVAVRMVSEGVDIPRLRVGVFATNATTELFFRQAVGRLVRWRPGGRGQKSFCFIPDDPRLRAHAFQVAEQRRHCLHRVHRDGRLVAGDPAAFGDLGDAEQLSIFAPISAVALATDAPDWATDLEPDGEDAPDDDPDLLLDLPPVPTPGGVLPDGGAPPVNRRQQKQRLREANAERARVIVKRTNMTHAQVNAELNRLAGLARITEATVEQLEARLLHAERWLQRV